MLTPDEEAELIKRDQAQPPVVPLTGNIVPYLATALTVAIAAYVAFFADAPGLGLAILAIGAVVAWLES